jgi:hypothetical protein
MNTKKNTMTAAVMTAAGILLSLIGVCAVYSQESSDGSVVTPVPYTSEKLRDPFEGYVIEEDIPIPVADVVEENVVLPVLTITGITWGSSFPQAIINDKVVKAGDMIGEVQVVSISKEGLEFLYKNRKFISPAPGAKSKDPSAQTTQAQKNMKRKH